MRNWVQVRTQAELDAAIAAWDYAEIIAEGHFTATGNSAVTATGNSTVTATGNSTVTATDNSTVRAYDNSAVRAYDNSTVRAYDNSTVRAYDNSTVRATGNSTVTATGNSTVTATGNSTVRATGNSTVTATGNSTVRATGNSTVTATGNSTVTATGNSTVRAYDNSAVRAYGNSAVRATGNSTVTATGNSTVTATGNSTVRAAPYVAVHVLSERAGVTGGVQIVVPPIKTAADWCAFQGVEAVDGVVTLFKAVKGDFTSPQGADYSPGSTPEAADWDGGRAECGGGLHFSPSPGHALAFFPDAKRFVACPVRMDEIAVHYPADYPDKVKARRVCAPCYEVTVEGRRVEQKLRDAEPAPAANPHAEPAPAANPRRAKKGA